MYFCTNGLVEYGMKILVCGSRNWTNEDQIAEVLSEYIQDWPLDRDEPTIMHGTAKGADSMAGRLGLELGFWVEEYPADWDKHGRSAGPIRNIEMLDMKPDLVLAFQVGKSRGTQHTIDHARKRGIPVRVFK